MSLELWNLSSCVLSRCRRASAWVKAYSCLTPDLCTWITEDLVFSRVVRRGRVFTELSANVSVFCCAGLHTQYRIREVMGLYATEVKINICWRHVYANVIGLPNINGMRVTMHCRSRAYFCVPTGLCSFTWLFSFLVRWISSFQNVKFWMGNLSWKSHSRLINKWKYVKIWCFPSSRH
jgi:hypothetical protein